jgi:hypothetical protein
LHWRDHFHEESTRRDARSCCCHAHGWRKITARDAHYNAISHVINICLRDARQSRDRIETVIPTGELLKIVECRPYLHSGDFRQSRSHCTEIIARKECGDGCFDFVTARRIGQVHGQRPSLVVEHPPEAGRLASQFDEVVVERAEGTVLIQNVTERPRATAGGR